MEKNIEKHFRLSMIYLTEWKDYLGLEKMIFIWNKLNVTKKLSYLENYNFTIGGQKERMKSVVYIIFVAALLIGKCIIRITHIYQQYVNTLFFHHIFFMRTKSFIFGNNLLSDTLPIGADAMCNYCKQFLVWEARQPQSHDGILKKMA